MIPRINRTLSVIFNITMSTSNPPSPNLSYLPLTMDDPTSSSESPVSTTPSFCAAELQRALTEQTLAFTIKGSVISPSQPDEARITLLEGKEIDVQLTLQGFTVILHRVRLSKTIVNIFSRLLAIRVLN